jgi:flagellar protein FliO/FliZ
MESGIYLKVVLGLAFVLALIVGVAWLLRRYGIGQEAAERLIAGRRRRLKLIESLSLDPRHRLVLIERDDRQHLLLLGAGGPLVVEQNLGPSLADPRPEGRS